MAGEGPLESAPGDNHTETNQWVRVAQDIYHGVFPAKQKPDVQQELKSEKEEDPSPNFDSFLQSSKEVVQRIDTQGRGYVTREQLGQAVEDPSFTGRQAQILAAMYANFNSLNDAASSTGSSGSDRISLTGINNLLQQHATFIEKINQLDDVQGTFCYPPHKSFSMTDIKSMLSNPNTSEKDKKSLEFIQDHFAEIGKSKDRITGDDIVDYTANGIENAMDSPEGGLVIATRSFMHLVREAQTDGVSRNLYGTDDPLINIKPDAIKQGLIGDCAFEAALASVASTNPEAIKNSIQNNHNGTYTVTFQGDKNWPITVSALTDAELGLYNHASKYGTWASIMEKAFSQYLVTQDQLTNQGGSVDAPIPMLQNNLPPQETADMASRINERYTLLTGNDPQVEVTASLGQDKLRADLQAAFSSHPPKAVMTVAPKSDTGLTPDRFTAYHAYCVLGFDPNKGNGGEIEMFNSWGKHFTVSPETFTRNFTHLVIAN